MSRPIADVLRELRGGELYDELSDALASLVHDVTVQRKGGSLTLKLDVKPNSDSTVKVAGAYSVKAPKPNHGDNIFFVRGSGDLVREDPRQGQMFSPRNVVDDDENDPGKKVMNYDD